MGDNNNQRIIELSNRPYGLYDINTEHQEYKRYEKKLLKQVKECRHTTAKRLIMRDNWNNNRTSLMTELSELRRKIIVYTQKIAVLDQQIERDAVTDAAVMAAEDDDALERAQERVEMLRHRKRQRVQDARTRRLPPEPEDDVDEDYEPSDAESDQSGDDDRAEGDPMPPLEPYGLRLRSAPQQQALPAIPALQQALLAPPAQQQALPAIPALQQALPAPPAQPRQQAQPAQPRQQAQPAQPRQPAQQSSIQQRARQSRFSSASTSTSSSSSAPANTAAHDLNIPAMLDHVQSLVPQYPTDPATVPLPNSPLNTADPIQALHGDIEEELRRHSAMRVSP